MLEFLAVTAGVFLLKLVIATATRARLGIIVPTVIAFLIFEPVRVLRIILVLGCLVIVYLLSITPSIHRLRNSPISLILLLHITILLLLLVFTRIRRWPLKPPNENLNTLDFIFVLLEDLHELTRIHLFLDHNEQLNLLLLLNALVHGVLCKPRSCWSGYGRIINGDRDQLRHLNEVLDLVVGYRLLDLPPSGQLVSFTTIWHRMVLLIEEMERLGVKVENQLLHVTNFF